MGRHDAGVDPATAFTQYLAIMQTVITRGTGKRAGLADGTFAAGKTGTTENSGDAWFVGFTDRLTVAVWVPVLLLGKPSVLTFAVVVGTLAGQAL